jgi:hypothetical protein
MRFRFRTVATLLLLSFMTVAMHAQTAAPAGSALATPSPTDPGTIRAATVPAAPPKEGTAKPASVPDKRTDKQRVLASQADRLVDMANELKAQVDLTNKNILSVKVVEKAQEIEALAKGMKDQAKRSE